MVSDFIEEGSGYLQLTQKEYDEAKKHDPTITRYARQLLEYGEAKEGYWMAEKLMGQVQNAVKIADFKYPRSEGWRVVWIFDHSSIASMPEGALEVSKMNVNPGGKQRVPYSGKFWNVKFSNNR